MHEDTAGSCPAETKLPASACSKAKFHSFNVFPCLTGKGLLLCVEIMPTQHTGGRGTPGLSASAQGPLSRPLPEAPLTSCTQQGPFTVSPAAEWEQDHLAHLLMGWAQGHCQSHLPGTGSHPAGHSESVARVQTRLPGELGKGHRPTALSEKPWLSGKRGGQGCRPIGEVAHQDFVGLGGFSTTQMPEISLPLLTALKCKLKGLLGHVSRNLRYQSPGQPLGKHAHALLEPGRGESGAHILCPLKGLTSHVTLGNLSLSLFLNA